MKSYSTSKLDDVRTYGTNQFNRLAELAHLNAVLNVADSVVDKILPAVETTQVQDETTPSVCTDIIFVSYDVCDRYCVTRVVYTHSGCR